ncbi:MAG: YqgE/AlgH family protein [Chromatiales bacterium]|jgi:putative transcriptional regulator|nr:YqgE/AlgH family protein [Chromatiales bacterium]
MNLPMRLTNQFLIAMPTLRDPNFFHGVTYVCEHNANGAMGVMINRPLEIRMGDVLEQMKIPTELEALRRMPVFLGGPVQCERGFVLHQPLGKWRMTMPITDTFGVTSSRDILEAMAQGQGPEICLVALGYAGWGPGQLESELADNAWINVPADARVVFQTPPEQRWEAAAALTGVDIHRLSAHIGHA